MARAIMSRFAVPLNDASGIIAADDLVFAIRNGTVIGEDMADLRPEMMHQGLWIKTNLYLVVAVLFVLLGTVVDVNTNSMHGFYRDHLANAFLVGRSDDSVDNLKTHNHFLLSQLSPDGSSALPNH